MRLKRISLQGFKSFADHVSLELDEGVTAIVGPNGSGKSNIVEAIRWVLGEQNARRLRGYRMDDLIFSGSTRRRPVNLAEVVLYLDNQDGVLPTEFSEITVSRRVDREGTGEYYLNRIPCRMRDILDLFLGTGLGRVSYALIGQGELDLIISGRPEDRGAMVEEVGGLSRVKERLHRADIRKVRLRAAMDRMADSIAEMSERLEPLSIEAQRALEHEKLTAAMRAMEKDLQLNRLAALRKEANRRQRSIDRLKDELQYHVDLISDKDRQLEQLRGQSTQLVNERGQYRSSLEAVRGEMSEKEQMQRALRERMGDWERERSRLEEEMRDSWAVWVRCRGERREAGEAVDTLLIRREETGSLRDRLKQQAAQYAESRQESQEQLMGLEKAVEESRKGLQEIEVDKARLDQALQQGARELEEARANLKKLESSFEEAVALESQLQDKLNDSTAQASEKSQAVAEIEDRIQDMDKAIEILLSRKTALEERRQAGEARIRALEEMDRLNSGYSRGARLLLGLEGERQLRHELGIRGAVGDLIKPRAGFERALEAVLGMHTSDLVIRSGDQARTAITHLKQAEAGRVTFWLDSALPENRVSQADEADLPEGFLARGPEMIHPESPASRLGERLVEDVLVFDTMASVPSQEELRDLGARAVTLEGDILFPGGMRGGAGDEGVWVRRVERAFAERDLVGTRRQVEVLQGQLDSAQEEIASLRKARDQESRERDRLQVLRGLAEERLLQHRRRQEEIASRVRETELRVQEMEKELASNQEKLSQLEAAGTSVQERLKQSSRELDDLRGALLESREAAEETESRLSRVSADLESIDSQIDVRRKWWERLSSDMLSMARARKNLVSRLSEGDESRDSWQESLKELSRNLELGARKAEKLRSSLDECERSLGETGKQQRQAREAIEEAQSRVRHLESRLHREEVAMARLETEEKGVLQLLGERGVDQHEIQAAQLLESPQAVQADLESCRETLAAMGVVNPLAVGEYERLTERYSLFTSTWDDLSQALTHLEGIRGTLVSRMKRVFRRTLAEVDGRFTSTFQRLFGGGECRLVISGSDQEEAVPGVDIVAQPPGKKLQHLSLLSGGERALTAIAFLFALLDLRAAPFVVFDEIDAALDEGNVDRFSRFVTELSQRMQIVLVTHQRRTMECADVLYGTTMDDSGVTQIIPARMADLEETPGTEEREAS